MPSAHTHLLQHTSQIKALIRRFRRATLVDEVELDDLALIKKAQQYRLYDGFSGVCDKTHKTPLVWDMADMAHLLL